MMMMMNLVNILLLAVLFVGAQARKPFWEEEAGIVMPGQESSVPTSDAKIVGTRWAILIAGSNGYWNYRHQADVCHAYQVLRRGGLKEENIIVFMFDDIANNPENPLPGVIINSPDRMDVYKNVPKDYTGKDVTVQNFLAALLGDKTAIHGGSGKVVNSGPEDHVFVYYSDHGGPGVLGMPNNPNLFAIDLIQTLKKKHAAAGYKEMVMYIEACESGSIFEGLLPNDLNIYVTTAANAEESSWGTYCPGMFPAPPPEFQTCLGDLYSVAWMEDSEAHNLLKETLRDQYAIVKSRTSNHNTYLSGSHVMQYGNTSMSPEKLCLYFGFDPANVDENIENAISSLPMGFKLFLEGKEMSGIEQRDADLLHFWTKYTRSSQNSLQKIESRKELLAVIAHRVHVDRSVKLIGEILFGADQGSIVLGSVRSQGEVLVDDWDCMKRLVRTFEASCGPLKQYGMKHMRAFANICNAGIDDTSKVRRAAEEACGNGVSHGFVATPVMEHFSA